MRTCDENKTGPPPCMNDQGAATSSDQGHMPSVMEQSGGGFGSTTDASSRESPTR